MTLDIEQDSKIAHAQSICGLGLVQAFDVSMQSMLQPFNLANDETENFCECIVSHVMILARFIPILDEILLKNRP